MTNGVDILMQNLTMLAAAPASPGLVGNTPLIAAVSIFLAGGITMLWGRHLMRGMLITMGVLSGAAAGFLLAPMSSADGGGAFGGWTIVYICLGLGAAIGAVAGLLLFRGILAFSISVVLGLALGSAAWASVMLLEQRQSDEVSESLAHQEAGEDDQRLSMLGEVQQRLRTSVMDALTSPLESLREPTSEDVDRIEPSEDRRAAVRAMVEQVTGRFGGATAAAASEIGGAWRSLGRGSQTIVAGCYLLGTVLGLLIGVVYPRLSAAAITGAIGSMLMVGAAFFLSEQFQLGWVQRAEAQGFGWVAPWAVLAAFGTLWQCRGLRAKPGAETKQAEKRA